MRLVLASASPQRQQILAKAGYVFEVVDPGEVEDAVASAGRPEELAAAKACAKARHVAAALLAPYPAVVVAADTLVVLGSEIIGKPRDRADAVGILTRLSGTRQRVISGLCLWPVTLQSRPAGTESQFPNSRKLVSVPAGPRPKCGVATTWVQMRRMSAAQIQAYVASGASDGKAGAYAIQEGGDRFVEALEGSFLNVVGFPLELFEAWLPDFGF
ncbi:MAG: Maf family protein [Planctomycetota bacterium]